MATEAAASTSTSAAAVAATIPTPPIATPKPYKVKDPFGLERDDPYFWLREKKNPEGTRSEIPRYQTAHHQHA